VLGKWRVPLGQTEFDGGAIFRRNSARESVAAGGISPFSLTLGKYGKIFLSLPGIEILSAAPP
jgi:hypothetical protein